jgi:hypothetical protein
VTPAGLNPTDPFRVIFVSSAGRDATSPNIADYDAFITTLAHAAGLTYKGAPVTGQALVSTPTVNANDPGRLPTTSTVPIFRVDGALVASGGPDLWDGAIAAPINVSETGIDVTSIIVWTGTTTAGTRGQPLGGEAFVTVGLPDLATELWVNTGSVGPLTNPFHLYGYHREKIG